MKRTLLSLLVAGALSLTLGACSSSQQDSGGSDGSDTGTEGQTAQKDGNSTNELDKTVVIKGLTIDVPGGWVEDPYDSPSDGYSSGIYSYYLSGGDDYITVSYTDEDLTATPEDAISLLQGEYEDGYIGASEFSVEKIGETTLGDTSCSEYKIEYYLPDADGNDILNTFETAFVYADDMHYEISVGGETFSIEDVMENASLI